MSESLEKSIQRLEALIRLRGQSMSSVLVADIEAVVKAVRESSDSMKRTVIQ